MACRPVSHRLIATLLLAAAWTSAAAAATVTLYTEDFPPFSWIDKSTGKITGLSADIVAELMRRAGMPATVPAVAPWARAMVLTSTTANACLYTTARVPEREANYQWVGPIGRNEWVLYARRADHITLRSLDDARRYQIGSFIGDASVTFLREHQLQVSVAAYSRLNPAKLHMQRIQLWSVGRLPGLYLQREMGITDFEPVLTFAQADMYLACHKGMDPAEIARLNDILRGMYRDGTVQRIYARYGYEKEAPRIEAAQKPPPVK
jgi:polar amino acid transport system substrate-binding protein